MAISFERVSYGLPNYWSREMRVGDFLFNQISGTGIGATQAAPGAKVYTQADRENIITGLLTALQQISDEFGFYPFPVYVTETVKVAPLMDLETQVLRLPHKRIQAIGSRGLSTLAAGSEITYTDTDGDGITDTATLTVTVPAGTSAAQVRVFFQVSDGAYAAGDERYEIAPCEVSVSGTTATIRTRRAYCVKPSIWARPYGAPNFAPVNTLSGDLTAASFITHADVYRVYPEPIGAVTLYTDPYLQTGDATAVVPNEFEGGAIISDADRGEIKLRNVTGAPWAVTSAQVSYLAGYPLNQFGRFEDSLLTGLIRLANCRMPTNPADSNDARLKVFQADQRVEVVQGGQVARFVDTKTPFGVRVGEIAAYNAYKKRRILPRLDAVENEFSANRYS